jgi:xylulokinase
MQHGTVFWNSDAEKIMASLDPSKTLLEQMKYEQGKGAFSHPFSPNWQDASTQKQCEQFDKALGSKMKLAEITGSSAHHVCPPTSTNTELFDLLSACRDSAALK